MGLLWKTLSIALFAWILVRIIVLHKIFRNVRYGIPVFNHNPGPCKMFHVNGSEDIDVLPNGIAVFSSGLKFELSPQGVDPAMLNYKGVLYTFNMNQPDEGPKKLPLDNFEDSDFRPHGIDFYTDPKTQEVTLFVINHSNGKHLIEIFQFDQENLVAKHRKTVEDEKIYSPNDVLGVGPDSFYITNDRYFQNLFMGVIEAFYPLKVANVAFYDGSNARFVADSLVFANGIAMDVSQKYVFVTQSMLSDVMVYERTSENDLVERQRIDVGGGADNIVVDENGDLWLGMANILYFDYATNFSLPCPSQVLQVQLSVQQNGQVPFQVEGIREVFANDGKGDFKCSATALHYRSKMLIGNPFSNLMYCDIVAV